MPVTFSSFGDIVAVLQLAWQLRRALSEATGASTEICELLIDMDSFTRTLQRIKASIEKRSTPLEPSVEHGIKHAIIACHAGLRAILTRLAAFKTRITSKVGGVAWRQYWVAAAWSILGGRKEVDALRTRLTEQLGVIQTYLSLSHAKDQSAVHAVVVRQASTLERVYSVIQDIQLRFDVGALSFQFYDRRTGQYYQPFARTSLTRFMQLLELDYERKVAYNVAADDSSPASVQQTLARTQTQCVMTQSFTCPEYGSLWATEDLDCCYFKERAFGQWQVLIGFPYMPDPNSLRIFKHLVKRKHALNTACNCDGPQCKVLLREDIQRAHYERDMARTIGILNQIAVLGLVMEAHDARRHHEMCKEIFTELRRFPDGIYLRHTIIPLLELHVEHQRPSGDCIVRLLRHSPLSGIQLKLGSLQRPAKDYVSWKISPAWSSEWLATALDIPDFYICWDTNAPVLSRYI